MNDGDQITPIFFADDAILPLQGDQIQAIIATLKKIAEYYKVSGLKLNLRKCEILALNCNNADIENMIQQTGMKRVNTKAAQN